MRNEVSAVVSDFQETSAMSYHMIAVMIDVGKQLLSQIFGTVFVGGLWVCTRTTPEGVSANKASLSVASPSHLNPACLLPKNS
jgi:hypothetical protein